MLFAWPLSGSACLISADGFTGLADGAGSAAAAALAADFLDS
jgi:hypothetical protein